MEQIFFLRGRALELGNTFWLVEGYTAYGKKNLTHEIVTALFGLVDDHLFPPPLPDAFCPVGKITIGFLRLLGVG